LEHTRKLFEEHNTSANERIQFLRSLFVSGCTLPAQTAPATMETTTEGRETLDGETFDPVEEMAVEETVSAPAGAVTHACAPIESVRAATIECENMLATTMETATEGRESMDAESLDPADETPAEETAESEADKLEAECNEIEQIATELKYNATHMLEKASKFKAEADKLEKQAAKNQKKASKLELDSFMKQQQVDDLRNKADENAQFVLSDEQVNTGQEHASLTLKDAKKKQGQKALHFERRANLKNEAKHYRCRSFARRLETMIRGFSDKVCQERAEMMAFST
jgi:hypothetical protein